jgi:DNA-binding NtrC family response regulator
MELKEILLVDAKAPISEAIGFILQNQGYLVLLAPDIETAAAELNDHQIDLIIAIVAGYEEDKFAFLQQAKRRFPQTKVVMAGNPMKMAWQAFEEEVDDYLLSPFTVSELCRKVNRCLHKRNIARSRQGFKEEGGPINERVLHSLRVKFLDINNTLFSIMAHIKILGQKDQDILSNSNFTKIDKMSNDLKNMMSITEEFLYNKLVSTDKKCPTKEEYKSVSYGV